MLTAALILVISFAMLAQFALSYWRVLLVSTAAEPLSDSLYEATGQVQELGAQHFPALLAMRELCPDLGGARESWTAVRLYYRALAMLKVLPLAAVARWAIAEQRLCTHYAAVLLDRRLQANQQFRLGLDQH